MPNIFLSYSRKDFPVVQQLGNDVPNSEAFCLSLDPTPKKIGAVACFPWLTGLEELGL